MRELKDRLKERRAALGLSQTAVAERVAKLRGRSFSQQAYGFLESGKTQESPALPAIAEVLQTPLEWLLKEQGLARAQRLPGEPPAGSFTTGPLASRIDFLLRIRGLSSRDVAARGGISDPKFIDSLLAGEVATLGPADLAKLCLGFGTTKAFLLGQTDDPEPAGEPAIDPGAPRAEPPQKWLPVTYAGMVEAGTWREAAHWEDPDQYDEPFYEPPDKDYPWAKLFRFKVAGDSMNALKPRPILAGDNLICLDFESLGTRIELRQDMVVVIERVRAGGQLRERSVKQLEIYDDRTELCPRSTNPRHKPIVIPERLAKDATEEDGTTVTILAIVRRISSDVAM